MFVCQSGKSEEIRWMWCSLAHCKRRDTNHSYGSTTRLPAGRKLITNPRFLKLLQITKSSKHTTITDVHVLSFPLSFSLSLFSSISLSSHLSLFSALLLPSLSSFLSLLFHISSLFSLVTDNDSDHWFAETTGCDRFNTWMTWKHSLVLGAS